MNEIKKNDIALLIIGYDPYIDVWNHYFYLLNKYWPNRPKTYLATNEIVPNYDNVSIIPIGKDAEWSKKVYESLDIIHEKYIVLLLEDFFTTTNVDNNIFNSLVQIVAENQIDYCKLLNQKKITGKQFKQYPYLHIIDKKDDYGISLQPAIWKKDFLKQLVGKENYNAWIFEFNQIKNKIQNKDRINCIADDRNILQITHVIVQSKYLRNAIKTFKKQGYIINTDQRKEMTIAENSKYNLKRFFSDHSPVFVKPFFKRIGRLLKVDFVSDRKMEG